MRIAHIIMVHKSPDQLLRLINRLAHPNFDFYIHIDKKVNIGDFNDLKDHPQVYFVQNRVRCNWGGWSFTKGILSSMKEVLESARNYDFLNLISGQDYPLYPPQEIYNFFLNKIGKNFLYLADTTSEWSKRAVSRYEKYHFTDMQFAGKYFVQRLVNKIVPKRKLPNGMKLYGGSNSSWWMISQDCAAFVVGELYNNVEFDKFFKYSWGSDEFVIASVIMNSSFKSKCINNNYRYIDWSAGGGHPKVLNVEDLPKITGSKMFFARKFDLAQGAELFDKIDQLNLKYMDSE